MLRADFHIVACTCYIYTSILNVPLLPRLSLCTTSLPLTIEALYFSEVLAMDLWLDSSLSCFLHERQDLNRKTARRGKRWLSNWRHVRRGQPTVDFEIRAL